MAHISTVGAGIYSILSVTTTAQPAVPGAGDAPDWQALFAETLYEELPEVREFPSMGTPPNIVNVPSYGAATSSQIQGQADAPSMELQINYKGTDWDPTGGGIAAKVGDGISYAFRFTFLLSDPGGNTADSGTSAFTVENSSYYWLGKIEALAVQPNLTDANIGTLTLSIQSDFSGAFTV